MIGRIAAEALRLYCAPRARRFENALVDVHRAQRNVIARIIRAAATTAYAQSLGLVASDGVKAFRVKVPLAAFESVERWIEAQRTGQANAISPGKVRHYEPTSGSTGAIKRIPYNDALLGSFHGLFAVWSHDVLTHVIKPRSARTFMSVSAPVGGSEGFTDDRDYLNGVLRAMVSHFLMATPKARTPDEFRDDLVCRLINTDDLEIVSLWNPSYLLILMDHFSANRERLMRGVLPHRRALLSSVQIAWQSVWPSLKLISCWTSAYAADAAGLLAQRLPHAVMQGKGLLATEAPITVPMTQAQGYVPLVDEVFLELMDETGCVLLLHEAELDREYELIITQSSGLLRYRLGDRVRITGRYKDAPLMDFVGRTDVVCDLVGEKLHENFVARALARVLRQDAFRLLIPVIDDDAPPCYCVLTDDLGASVEPVEQALAQAYRYREARFLGQLAPLQIIADSTMRAFVHEAFMQQGMRAGDIKDRVLMTSPERAKRLFRDVAQRMAAQQS